MRVQLSGGGEAIPLEALPDLTDLGDTVTVKYEENDTFNKAEWLALGFTHYQVICVGGAGGNGGAEFYGGYTVMGGGGGGGGLHVVEGVLDDLPDSCPVVVGAAGVAGVDADQVQLIEDAAVPLEVPEQAPANGRRPVIISYATTPSA